MKKPKYMHSPDRYEPAAVKSAEPPRIEYHENPTNYTTAETPKRAGEGRGKIQQLDGTGNLRAENRTKSAAMPDDNPKGSNRMPSGVQSYNDTGELP